MNKRYGRYACLYGDYWRHPKTAFLSDSAAGVYSRCLSYCADQMTDGFIPRNKVLEFITSRKKSHILKELTTATVRNGREYAPVLVANVQGFCIESYAKRNLTRAEWEANKKYEREKKQKLKENFPPDIHRETRRKAEGNPRGRSLTRTTGQQDSLKREGGPSPLFLDNTQKKKNEQKAEVPEYVQVTELWVAVGREVTGDERIQADPEHEKAIAGKLYDRGLALAPEAPIHELRKVFFSYWTSKREAERWPFMRFCLADFDAHIDHGDQQRRKERAEAEKKQRDREYQLRQRLADMQGQYQLLKTEESKERYRKAHAEYHEYKKAIGDN